MIVYFINFQMNFKISTMYNLQILLKMTKNTGHTILFFKIQIFYDRSRGIGFLLNSNYSSYKKHLKNNYHHHQQLNIGNR